VTSIIANEGDGFWREYEGGYEDWKIQKARSDKIRTENGSLKIEPAAKATVKLVEKETKEAKPVAAKSGIQKLNGKERQELEALPLQIEVLEAEQAEIGLAMSNPDLYKNEPELAASMQARLTEVTNQVDDMLVEAKRAISQGHRVLVTTLTKRLAEELTSFYKGVGMRIKYLHSEIDTLERMEIIRDLRLGEFDILVGINLLREGLDIPEVALVGILDADKEGFLRSTRSLVQTIGRAARNSEGRVILYGFRKTPSIEEAMKVTSERREKQIEYNAKHGITPETVLKKVSGGVIEVLRGVKKTDKKGRNKENSNEALTPEAIDAKILELKQMMKEASKELRFEEAARLRDEIKKLTDLRFML
jgi:superfamily II DNA/RNA helicase